MTNGSSAQPRRWLVAEPLTAESFAAFGQVLERRDRGMTINQGTSVKYPNLCRLEVDRGAQAALHLFRPEPQPLPCALRLLERHPLSSQVFMPLGVGRFAVVVAAADPLDPLDPEAPSPEGEPSALRAFVTDGKQGIQFARSVWHHPLIALDAADYIVIDRYCRTPEESASNLEEHDLTSRNSWLRLADGSNSDLAPDNPG